MINPSVIKSSALPSVPLDVLPSAPIDSLYALPNSPGVYFVMDSQGGVLYIGRSVKIRERFKGHHRKEKFASVEGAKVAYLLIDKSALESVEAEMIDHFDPPLNGADGGILTVTDRCPDHYIARDPRGNLYRCERLPSPA